jgi:hypothetical protein
MKSSWLAGLLALAVSRVCYAGDYDCTPWTVTESSVYWWPYPTTITLTESTTITLLPSCSTVPSIIVTETTTLTLLPSCSTAYPTTITSILTLFSGASGTTIFQTDIFISGGSIGTTYTTTVSGVQSVVTTFVSSIHDFNGTVLTIENTATAPRNRVSTGGIVGIGIGLFLFGGLIAACLLPFFIRRRPKKDGYGGPPAPAGYAAPPAQGGYAG